MLQVIAEHLSVEEVEIIKDMFTLMDTDKDGKVTYEELKAGLRKVGSQLAEPEIKMLMEVVSFCKLYAIHYGFAWYNFSSLIVTIIIRQSNGALWIHCSGLLLHDFLELKYSLSCLTHCVCGWYMQDKSVLTGFEPCVALHYRMLDATFNACLLYGVNKS